MYPMVTRALEMDAGLVNGKAVVIDAKNNSPCLCRAEATFVYSRHYAPTYEKVVRPRDNA